MKQRHVASIDQELNTKFTSEQQRLFMNLMFTASWFANQTQKFLDPFHLSGQQFNILRILRGAGDWVSMNTIKQRMVDKAPHTTRLVQKLLDKGLVDRHRCETDRRVVHVLITPKGLDVLAQIDKASDQEQHFINKISPEDARTASDIIDQIRS